MKNMLKRVAAFVAAIFLATVWLAMPAYADEYGSPPTGYWELKEVEIKPPAVDTGDENEYLDEYISIAASDGEITYYGKTIYPDGDTDVVDLRIAWTPPPQRIASGEESKLEILRTYYGTGGTNFEEVGFYLQVFEGQHILFRNYSFVLAEARGTNYALLSPLPVNTQEKLIPEDFSMPFPYSHVEEGSVMKIHMGMPGKFYPFYQRICVYHYVFVPETDGLFGGSKVTTDTQAGTTHGDDSSASASVPAAIAVGIASAAVAAGAAGATAGATAGASGASNGGEQPTADDEKRRSTFRMVIHKDFGDAIRYDKQPLPIYARMEETTPEGAVVQRPDLSARISIGSGGGVSVSGCAVAGDHMGAWVSAEGSPGGQNATEGIVSFRFSGEGGVFTNNVRFRLIGEPYLAFPQRGKEPSPTVYAIEGDGRTYRVAFELRDFMNPATVRFEGEPPFDVTLEQTGQLSYIAHLKNETAASNKNMVEWHRLRLIAENEAELAHEDVQIGVYQEGLALDRMELDSDGRIRVVSYLSDADTEAGKALPSVRLRFTLATPGEDKYGNPTAVLTELGQGDLAFGELTGYNEAGRVLAEHYRYSIEAADGIPGTFYFRPESQIPEGDSPNLLSMEVEAGEHALTLGYRLLGEKQAPFTGDFDKELKAYLARVRRYMPPEAWADAMSSLRFMINMSETPELSTTQLRLMSRQLLEWAVDFYTRDAEAELNWAAFLEWAEYGASWVQWFGDQAFALLMTKYFGPSAAAVIVPFKELFVQFIAEAGASWYHGDKLDMEYKEVNNKIFEYINSTISKGISSGDPKTIGAVIALLFFSNFIKNIINNRLKKDYGVYDAIADAAKDMSVFALKKLVGMAFQKWVEDGKLEEMYNKYAAKWFKEALEKYAPDLKITPFQNLDGTHSEPVDVTKLEYLQELLDSLFGDSVKPVVDTAVKAGGMIVEASGNPLVVIGGVKVYVVNSTEMLSRALEYIFDSLLSMVAYLPTAAIEVPVDPPYFKAKTP